MSGQDSVAADARNAILRVFLDLRDFSESLHPHGVWAEPYSDAPHTCMFGLVFSRALGQPGEPDFVDIGAQVFHDSLIEFLSTVTR